MAIRSDTGRSSASLTTRFTEKPSLNTVVMSCVIRGSCYSLKLIMYQTLRKGGKQVTSARTHHIHSLPDV